MDHPMPASNGRVSALTPFLVLVGMLAMPAIGFGAPGDLDATFNGTGIVTTLLGTSDAVATAVVLQADGKLVAAGYASNGSDYDFALARYDAAGMLDPAFGGGTGKVTHPVGPGDDQIEALIQQADGKLVAAGLSYNATFDTSAIVVARYLDGGTPDPAFGGGTGRVVTPITGELDGALALVQQTDGKLVVAGYAGADIAVVRYEDDGDLDLSFNGTGKVTTEVGLASNALAIVQQASDQKLVVAGSSDSEIVLVRYETNGTPDALFGGGDGIVTETAGVSVAEARALVQQPDGKLVVAGVGEDAGDADVLIARFDAAGVLDGGFGSAGITLTPIGGDTDEAHALVRQDDGKLVVAGSTVGPSDADVVLVRYDDTGTPDAGFGAGGIVTTGVGTDDTAHSALIQPNGGIVVAGAARVSGTNNFLVARYLSLTGTTTSTTVPSGSTTTSTTLPANVLVPGGPAAQTTNDCYLELQVHAVTPAQVQNGQVVSCIDGDPCDQGPCGDRRCDVQVAACASQTDPGLPGCTPPATLDRVKLSGALAGSAGQLLAGPACAAPTQLQVPVKISRGGRYLRAKSRIVVRGNAKAPKGISPRKDKDKWTIQCLPRTAACAP